MAQKVVDWSTFDSDEDEIKPDVKKVYVKKEEAKQEEPTTIKQSDSGTTQPDSGTKQPNSGAKQPASGDKVGNEKNYPPRKTKAELIDIVKNHFKQKIYLQLVNVSYKAREDDVREFYQTVKFAGVTSKKEGSFQVEFNSKEDAIAFIDYGAGRILGREFYIEFSRKNYKLADSEEKKHKSYNRDGQESPGKEKTYSKKTQVVYQPKDDSRDQTHDDGKGVTKGRGEKNFTADGKNKLEQDKIHEKKSKNGSDNSKKGEHWTHEKADESQRRDGHVEYVKKDYEKKRDKDYEKRDYEKKEYREQRDQRDYKEHRDHKDYEQKKYKDYDKKKDKDYEKKKDKDHPKDKSKKKFNSHLGDDNGKDKDPAKKGYVNNFDGFNDDEDAGAPKQKIIPLVINTTEVTQGNNVVEYKAK